MTPSREAASESAEARAQSCVHARAEQQLAALIRQAVAEEREACAALAVGTPRLAAAIRARGDSA